MLCIGVLVFMFSDCILQQIKALERKVRTLEVHRDRVSELYEGGGGGGGCGR